MRPRRYLVALVAWILGPGLIAGRAQELGGQTETDRETLLASAKAIMSAARYCALITLDESGASRVRAMDPFAPEDDMRVWLGTRRNTRKVEQIRRDPRVTLYYQAPDGSGYVSITGRARLVDDEGEKALRWKPEWEAFYTDRSGDYLLIEVVPERLEVIDFSRGVVAEPDTWLPPSVVFR